MRFVRGDTRSLDDGSFDLHRAPSFSLEVLGPVLVEPALTQEMLRVLYENNGMSSLK